MSITSINHFVNSGPWKITIQSAAFAAARVPGANEDVQRRELGDHLRHQVRELVAIGDAVDERKVLVEHRLPVHTVHAGVVEVVALEPPGVDKELSPVLANIDRE